MSFLLLSTLAGAGLGLGFSRLARGFPPQRPRMNSWKQGAFFGALLGLGVVLSGELSDAGAADQSSPNVKLLSAADFDTQVLRSPTPVVVDFFATWCGPCKRLSPMLDTMAGPLTNQVRFFKVDVDQAPALVERYKIEGMPTLLFFKNGQVANRILGLPDQETLQSQLSAFAPAK